MSYRRRTPHVLQMEAVECGAACLQMILGYYRRFVSLEALREACGVSRDGSKASNILKAARQYSLQAKGLRKEAADLDNDSLPAIIHWNFNHFVVLEGIDRPKNKVYLNDPAEGHRTVSIATLEESFTGVILIFTPAADFAAGGQPPSLLSAWRERLDGYKRELSFVLLVSLLLLFPGLVIPTFARVFVDNILIEGLRDWFVPLLLGMVFTAVLRGVLEVLRNHYLLRLETKMALASATRLFWHTLRLPMGFYQQRFAGDIANRIETNDRVAHLLASELTKTTLDLLQIGFFFLMMLQYNLLLTLIGVLFAALNIAALRFIAQHREEGYQRLQNAEAKLAGVAMHGLQTIESLKASGREEDFFQKWAGYQVRMVNAEQRLGELSIVLNAIPPLLNALTTIAILTIGGWEVTQGTMSIGALVAFQSLMQSVQDPVQGLVQMGGRLQEAQGDVQRLNDVLKTEPDPQTTQNSGDFTNLPDFYVITRKLEGYVEFRDVSFGYSKLAPPLLENFNLRIEPGERVALVGGSGSGKSTVSKLLAGLYEPWSGEILLDGKPRRSIPREIINNSLAMVDQEIFLFEGSAKDLVTLWDDTIPDNVIVQACIDAQIHEVISSRRGGYASLINEGGKNLSGGQRQRLEIARALVNNPSILVLDEATSALDPLTEKQVDNAVKRRACTALIVAHRLSTIRDCDEIVVMRYGKIIERGTHTELIALQGAYSALMKL